MDKLQLALDRARAERDKLQRSGGGQPVQPSWLRAAPFAAAFELPAADEAGATFAGVRPVEARPDLLLGMELLSANAGNPAAAAYKMLRTRVLQRMDERGWNTLAVVSPTPHDGKTFTAINLALAIAGDTLHTTLLVDFDLRKPMVARRFGFEPEYGVEDCLTGRVDISSAMVAPSGFKKLVLLPAREPQINSSELLTSERGVQLVQEIKHRYNNRIVIFDLPPILGADDALAFAPQVDCALLVVGASRTRREDLTRSMEVLQKVPILGTVLNGSRSEYSSGYVY